MLEFLTGSQHPNEDEILWDIEAQHLDEAEFMFELWEAALDAPNYTLAELAAGPEQRLLAHVDGLVVGGPVVAERLLWPTIVEPDAYYERVAAATLAICGADSPQMDRVLSVLMNAEGEQRRGIMRALELVDDPSLDAKLVGAIDSSRGLGTAAALEILAQRRVRVGDWVSHFLRSDDPEVARAAARLVRYCPDPRALQGLGALVQSDDPLLRHAALETALVRQVPGAWEAAVYWAFVPGESPFRRDALTWVAMLGDAAALQRVLALADSPEHRKDAIWAVGFSGRLAAVDWCVELLADAEIGRLAGEVICGIAGLPTEMGEFWVAGDSAEELQGLPELRADDLSANLVPDAEEALLVPEPGAIAKWWAGCRREFEDALRYLGGNVLTGPVIVNALWDAPMRRRQGLGLELELRTGAELVVDTRRLTTRQRVQLGGLAAAQTVDVQRGRPLGGMA
jgi:uncharacterized protein (TIGR02270 family)